MKKIFFIALFFVATLSQAQVDRRVLKKDTPTKELLKKVQEFLTEVSSKYHLEPFDPNGDTFQINFYRKEEVIEIEINYFVFNK